MGSGRWSTNVYEEHSRFRAASGRSTFDYSDTLHRSGRVAWKVHDSLNPYRVKVRESRDSAEHPASNSIAVLFDVTGSMGQVPVTLQKKLPELLGLLLRKNYINDPQILFGAIGDATCDAVPLQMGQFESDNRMDQNLEDIFLEGGGGGQQTESYELAMYFMARHTQTDCYDRRGKKGYLFLIGDEMAYPEVNRAEVRENIGDGLEQNVVLDDLVKELRQRYHVFFILPRAASYGSNPTILGFWRRLLGQNVLELAETEAVCETIALTIGMSEGTIDLAGGIADLKEFNVPSTTLKSVTKVLAGLPGAPVTARAGKALPGVGAKKLLPGRVKRL